MPRLLRDVGGDLILAEEISAPTVTVTRDSDGTEVSTGPATGSSGAWSYAITPAQVPEVELLHAEWVSSGATYRTETEVVGGFLCSVAEVQAAVDDDSKTEEEVEDARDWAEDWLERECRVAFRPRYASERLDGTGSGSLFLSNPKASSVITATVGGTAVSGDIVVDPVGVLTQDGTWTEGTRNVEVSYVHGWSSAPGPVRNAAILLARHRLLEDPSNAFERATSYTTEEATYSLVTPGVRGSSTPIPEVNAVINAYRYVLSIA